MKGTCSGAHSGQWTHCKQRIFFPTNSVLSNHRTKVRGSHPLLSFTGARILPTPYPMSDFSPKEHLQVERFILCEIFYLSPAAGSRLWGCAGQFWEGSLSFLIGKAILLPSGFYGEAGSQKRRWLDCSSEPAGPAWLLRASPL